MSQSPMVDRDSAWRALPRIGALWENKDEPDRGAQTPQPGSDRLHLSKKGGGW